MTAPSPTMTYAVSAETRAGGQAVVHARRSAIPFDGSAQTDEALPGPTDLLCAALCACILKNVERFSHLLPFRYESASIEVSAEREEPPPRIVRMHYRLRVVTEEPAARVELLHKNIRKFGTITNTLASACELTGEIEAVSPVSR
ncbi:MAG: OsmC family protein [Vicinamibacteria bacterium]